MHFFVHFYVCPTYFERGIILFSSSKLPMLLESCCEEGVLCCDGDLFNNGIYRAQTAFNESLNERSSKIKVSVYVRPEGLVVGGKGWGEKGSIYMGKVRRLEARPEGSPW